MTSSLFCFGYGYCCDYLGHDLMNSPQASEQERWNINGTTRDPDKKELLESRGVFAHLFNYRRPLLDPLQTLENITHILISTPPGDDGDPAFLMHKADILKLKNLKWVGYLSTTGVYGNRDGEWVDETSELRPTSQRGDRRKTAEEQWLSLHHDHGLPVHIFRLAGIYGPGRSALDSVRAGIAQRIEKPGHAFNRIHVEDIIQVLKASMAHPTPGQAYNLCDDEPTPSHEVISHACQLLSRAEPPLVPFDTAALAPITQSFYSDNKRVHNDKIKSALGVNLKYSNYRDGLKACLDAENYALSQMKDSDKKPSIFKS